MIRNFFAETFFSYVEKLGNESGCWLWLGPSNRGYGRLEEYPNIENGAAHRISYILAKGWIPQGMLVRHFCDTPCCVNPAHLLLGTTKDNVQDMLKRKRHKGGENNLAKRLPVPTKLDLRARYRAGTSIKTLQELFELTEPQVRKILNRPRKAKKRRLVPKTWRNTPVTEGYPFDPFDEVSQPGAWICGARRSRK